LSSLGLSTELKSFVARHLKMYLSVCAIRLQNSVVSLLEIIVGMTDLEKENMENMSSGVTCCLLKAHEKSRVAYKAQLVMIFPLVD